MAKSKPRRSWPKKKRDDFIAWHTKRLKELGYPDEIVKELTRARERWLPPATEDSTC